MKFLICVLSLATVTLANPALNYLCRNVPDETKIVNPNNCNSFVTCLGGHAFEQFCQEGLYYNQKTGNCDYPENVNCSPSGGGGGNPIDPSNPEMKPHPECIAAGPESNLLLPHETDCNKFLACDGIYAITMKCYEGLHFNNKLKICDHPENAGCR